MGFIKVGSENSLDINIFYKDQGSGDPILFIHGYPFNSGAWEKHESYFLKKAFRVISYDRRGFGQSSKPSFGYDWDTFADDLNNIIEDLDLENLTLVGHSMGTGEITRYLSKYGSKKIDKVVLISPLQPYLLKTESTPNGIELEVFENFKNHVEKDKYNFLKSFIEDFYSNGNFLLKEDVSEEKLRSDFIEASKSSLVALYDCIDTWIADFRWDLRGFDKPVLIIHGDGDQVLPIEATANELTKKIEAHLKIIDGGSHGIIWTHSFEICEEILAFINNELDTRERLDENLAMERKISPTDFYPYI